MNNIQHFLLAYIGYIYQKNKKFSYEQVQEALKKVGKEVEITTLRKEFSLLKSEHLIEFKTYYSRNYPAFTQKGRMEIKTRLPFKKFGDWDRKWRLVIFDIPEEERGYRYHLRDKLLDLGFGKVQDSTYISPYPLLKPIERLISDLGIHKYVRLMEISKIDDEKNLALKAWNLRHLSFDYEDYIKKVQRQIFVAKNDFFWPLLAKQLEKEYVDLFSRDPHLPEEFLPKNWPGAEAYKLFKEISNSY
jgi:phenylacetic acid degradation operon negative regulatory protein